jgi:hypothetical protein
MKIRLLTLLILGGMVPSAGVLGYQAYDRLTGGPAGRLERAVVFEMRRICDARREYVRKGWNRPKGVPVRTKVADLERVGLIDRSTKVYKLFHFEFDGWQLKVTPRSRTVGIRHYSMCILFGDLLKNDGGPTRSCGHCHALQ